MGVSLKNLVAMANASIARNTQYIEPRIMLISIIATIGFPLYYVIWHDIFPQPYENLELRLVGSVLYIPTIFAKKWPHWARRYLCVYWYFAVLYALPFFFTFMLFKNNGSTVWLLSTMIAAFLMILLLEWLHLIIQFSLGIFLAWLAYYLTTGNSYVGLITLESLPIYLFAIILGSITNYSAEMVRIERLRAMLAAASNIAHELRTPLLGIKSGAAGLQQYLPTLLDAYRMAKGQGLAVQPIRLTHLNSMQGVLERIEGEADHSNTIIDMLLMNTRTDGFSPEKFSVCSIGLCVEAALQRYPFSSEKERQRVVWDNNGVNFNFLGIELLMVHVLFNLMKNALYYIAKAGKGEIVIRLEKTQQGNTLIFKDTGAGIPPEVLPHIFTRFYSWSSDSANGFGVGTGIGLAFCQSVMRSFGGAIGCASQPGKYTEFTLTFPFQPETTL